MTTKSLSYVLSAYANARSAAEAAQRAARHARSEARLHIQEAQRAAREARIHARRCARFAKHGDEGSTKRAAFRADSAAWRASYHAHQADLRIEETIRGTKQRDEWENESRYSSECYGGSKMETVFGAWPCQLQGRPSEWLLVNEEEFWKAVDPEGDLSFDLYDRLAMRRNYLLAKAEAEAEARLYRRLGY